MKTIKNVLFLIGISLILSSCLGVETPTFTEEQPFIIKEIRSMGKTSNAYVGSKFYNAFGQLIAYHATIIAPKGLFNVGDTIKFKK